MSSNHLTLCCLLLLLPLIFPSIRVFPMSQLITSGGQRIGALASASGLISFRVDWCTVQGTLKNLLQHHSLKASTLSCSAFFMVQLLHPCMGTDKTTALTIWAFISKVMSLLLLCCLGLSYPYCLPKIVFWNEELVFKFYILPMCTTHTDIYWECSQQYNILQIIFKNMFCVSVLTYCMH